MERSHHYSASGQRRRIEQQFYQSQPPPPPPQLQAQPQSQIQIQIQNHLQQHQPQLNPRVNHNLSPIYRNDLKNLANKLNVKTGGYPPGYIDPNSKPKIIRNNNDGGSSSNGRDRGAKIVQRGFKFSEDQRRRLNEYFAVCRYPKPNDMDNLAFELRVKKEQIKNWFHDQRRKYKKSGIAKLSPRKTQMTPQHRKRLQEYLEKSFHPHPADSKRIVNEFEFTDQVHFRYENTHVKYDCLNTNEKIVQTRGFKFSDDQRARLKAYFDKNRYPNPYDMERLAYELDVKKEQVKNWFHDQRRKFKRENAIR